jgi:hypothetical protein
VSIRPMTLDAPARPSVAWRVRDLPALRSRASGRYGLLACDATVPSVGPRMGCSHCGKLGATAMPIRIERADRLPGGALMLVRAAIPSTA